ncbi:MAG: OmpA family protein [Bacteroidia bacterium]|jgi:outer membrane protein OmpA-like peptidoglycan-associated protein|nr:OmpA family protein [Bacteroidia bacterium]
MRTLVTHIIISVLLLFTAPMVQGQGSQERQGDKAFAVHNFARAARLYDAAFRKATSKEEQLELACKAARAYHRMNQFQKALQWYNDALGEERSNVEVLVAAADAAMRANEADKAQAYIKRALVLNPLHEKARAMTETLAVWKDHSGIPQANLRFAKAAEDINTIFSDYAPRWLGNELVITSSRPYDGLVPSFDGRTMQDYSRLYLFISRADGSFSEAIPLPVAKNKNAGVFAWDATQKRAFFTSCNNRKQRCIILEATFDPVSFSFSKPRVPAFINKKFHYGHPFVSNDGKMLYFSANLPGGYGGNDIYSISLKPDGSYGMPVNAGPLVNTAGEELFPALAGDSVLFFSSNGHKGYGGLDLFASRISGAGFSKIVLLPPPFNSISDDFGMSLKNGNPASGALSSGREGSCADNVYFFEGCAMPVLVKGRVEEFLSSAPISGAEIALKPQGTLSRLVSAADGSFSFYHCAPAKIELEATAEGYKSANITTTLKAFAEPDVVVLRLSRMAWPVGLSGIVVHRETGQPIPGQPVRLVRPGLPERVAITNTQGFYLFDTVPVNRIYTLKVERQGFFNESRVVNVPETDMAMLLNRQNGYDLDFELTPIVLKKEIVINNIYYDFDKATLRESSKMELGKLVSLMRDNPAMRIQISSHTDERGRPDYNERLSAMRAKSVVDYLVQSGIHPSRLSSQGYGKRFPVVKNARTEEEHQANRRTTFQVTDLNAPVQHENTALKRPEPKNNRLVYRVQFLITSTRRNPETDFAAISNLGGGIQIHEEVSGLLYRYEAGDRFTLAQAEALRNQIRAAGFPDSFVVPYIDNQRVSLQQAKEFKP